MLENNGMASAEMPPLPPSVAISPLLNSGSGSSPAAATTTTTISSGSKKQKDLLAGRLKLQAYRKKKAEEKKSLERSSAAGSLSERPLPNTLPEEGVQEKGGSSSIHFNEGLLVNGPGPSIISEEGAKAHSQAGTFNGLNTRDYERTESELQKENINGESSREVKESSNTWIKPAGSTIEEDTYFFKKIVSEPRNFPDTSGHSSGSTSASLLEATGVKLLPDDSVSSVSNAGESEIETTSLDRLDSRNRTAQFFNGQEDSIEVSAAPLSNGEGDNNLKRPVGASPSLFSMASSYNPLTAPAFPGQQSGPVSLVPQREKIEQKQSDYQFNSVIGDMKLGATGAPSEKQFSFITSKKPSPFNMRENQNMLPRLSDNFSYGPASVSTSSVLSMPLLPSTVPDSGMAFAMPISTSERDIPSTSLSDMTPAAMLNGISTIRHGMGSPNWSEEIQRNSERDDFAALEQYIADLTQEKFSLQRALVVARSLAETLAQENSALTKDFNSQGTVINQLQRDMEKQLEETKVQSLVLNSIMVEREKAQQESNSAVERSQILAGEVIGLEEKVLKLRSNELKLERDLESLKSENDSCRRQLATLEKDRQNLRSVVEALKEDKKLLQGQLRRKFVSGSSSDPQTSSAKGAVLKESKDVSTSTDDFDDLQARTSSEQKEQTSMEETEGSNQLSERTDDRFEAASSSTLTRGHDQVGLNLSPALAALPVDHFNIINNIDMLIMELGMEKESVMKSLKMESKRASELEALNAELSKKLEMQTQRLELAVAQNLAHGGTTVITNSNDEHQDNEFVDEGDEIVERVLGWIARLFPSGSSKRRTSKLL